MKTYSLFQYMSMHFNSMSFRESVMLICLLIMVLLILVMLEQLTKVLILALILFVIHKIAKLLASFLIQLIRRGNEDKDLNIHAYHVA